MPNLISDLRISIRQLIRSPGFSAASVITLGLGIGAATTLFGLVQGILLAPLPFPDPDRVVTLHSADPPRGATEIPISLPDLRDWAARSAAVPAMGVYSTLPMHLVLQSDAGARELRTTHVSAGFFTALGVAPLAGRVIAEADETGDPRVVVVSHGFWTDELGSDPAAVGRTLRLSDENFSVVGVMPAGFAFPEVGMEVWTPLAIVSQSSIPTEIRGVRFLEGIGRMGPEVTPEQARSELSSVAAALAEEYPESNEEIRGVDVLRLKDATVSGVARSLLLVFAAVGFVLVVACANVANLVLTRGLGRTREFAVRIALGAGRARLIRMLVTDSLVLGVLGGAAGTLIAFWTTGAIKALNAGVLPRIEEVEVSPEVLLFATLVSLLTVVASGLLPALASVRLHPANELRAGSRTGSYSVAPGTRRALIAAQFAASVVLLVGAGLLGRSLWHLQTLDVGFEPEGALSVSLVIAASRYPEREDYRAFHRETLDRFRAIPGVEAVGSIRSLPTLGTGESWDWELPGEDPAVREGRESADVLQLSPGLLSAMRIPLVAGRDFTDGDREDAVGVVLVNETFARTAFPGEEAVGRTIRASSLDWTIVGVTGDILQRGPQAPPRATIYLAQEQLSRRGMAFVLRASGDPQALVAPLLGQLREIDPGQALTQIQTLADAVDSSIARPRFFALFLGALATLTVVLTAIGLYGVLAFLVRKRTSEIGIRMALGATGREVVRVALSEGVGPVLAGTVLGVLIAVAGAGVTRAVLFGVEPLDPWTFVAAVFVLLLVAALATWIPARRAATLDPLTALRSE
ncbi:MAG: ABC transporter permease [Gemmatimonadota bacterium]